MDIASSIQAVTEEIVLRLAKTVHQELDVEYLCLAGGVALNCVANGRILREGPFRDIWIQPAAGDAGGALGAAISVWYSYLDNLRISNGTDDMMQGAYLGKRFTNREIISYLDRRSKVYANGGLAADAQTRRTAGSGAGDPDGSTVAWSSVPGPLAGAPSLAIRAAEKCNP